MSNLIINKVVNIEALKERLCLEFDHTMCDDPSDFDELVDEFIVQNVEIPAAEQAGVGHLTANIYEIIDNVCELRDLQRDFVDQLKSEK